jgi:hypothetical protein
MPFTEAFDAAGSSRVDGTSSGKPVSGTNDETVALQRAIDLGKVGGLIARRRLHDRVARDRARDNVEILRVEVGKPVARALRR